MSDKPRYRHDCSTCKFIKTATIEGIIYDVYRCTNTAIGEHTWLARYGDEGGNYWSMPWAILKEVNTEDGKNTTELLRQMQAIAREREEGNKDRDEDRDEDPLDLLGQKGTCSCGAPGEYTLDPYQSEVHEEDVVVCLCDDCYHDLAMEV